MRYFIILPVFLIIGAGCASEVAVEDNVVVQETAPAPEVNSVTFESRILETAVDLPVAEYASRRTFKAFGEYIKDRFSGYHVGDDIEYTDVTGEVPVMAIADGTVRHVEFTAGYGGLIIIDHPVEDEVVTALYGHVDLGSSLVSVGDTVERGEVLANLGAHESEETDGERKHLHFAIYRGNEDRLQGYERNEASVEDWINPQDFFNSLGHNLSTPPRQYSNQNDVSDIFEDLLFTVPADMEIEYVPSLKSLNIFLLAGEGTARDRSQIFIRYFDASSFLTLNTVNINSAIDLEVGAEDYIARRYDITKKPGVADFADQPAWRNGRHIVTDFAKGAGRKRYYVVAANPELDLEVYESFLTSASIK